MWRLLLLGLVPVVKAGLTMPTNFPGDHSDICIRMYGVEPELLDRQPGLNSTELHGGHIANLGSLSDADVVAFCAASSDLPSGRRLPFKDQWVVARAAYELCGLTKFLSNSQGSFQRKVFEAALAAEARGTIRLGEGTPSTLGIGHTPSVAMHLDYGWPTHLHGIIARSLQCSPWPGDETGQLGALSGTLNGVSVEELRVDVVVDTSPWASLYEHPLWFLFFTVVSSIACFGLAAMAGKFAYKIWKSRQAAIKKTGKATRGLTLFVLVAECISQFLMGCYWVQNGHFARRTPYQYLLFFNLYLMGTGMATTFLTAFFWQNLKHSCMSMSKKNTVWQQHWRLVVAITAGFVSIDIFNYLALVYLIKGFDRILTVLITVAQLAVAAYFIKEIRSTLKLITAALETTRVHRSSTAEKDSTKGLRYAGKYLFASAVFIILYAVWATVFALTGIMWTPHWGWWGIWTGQNIFRYGTSWTQVMAVAPPNTKKTSRKKTNRTVPHTSAGSTVHSNLSAASSSTASIAGESSNSTFSNANTATTTHDNSTTSTTSVTAPSSDAESAAEMSTA